MRALIQKHARGLILLGLLCCAGCATTPAGPPKYVLNWDQLRPGMTKHQVIALLGDPPVQSGPMTSGSTQPATGLVDAVVLALFIEVFDGRYERWEYGEFNPFENIL
jgi:hypothetical protein